MANNHKNKLGKKEHVVRYDGNTNVYQYMADPTLTASELEFYKRIEYIPARWVLVDVIKSIKSIKSTNPTEN